MRWSTAEPDLCDARDPQNTAEQVLVSAANAAGDKVEVHGALNAGDRLVVRGAERLTPARTSRSANDG
jgi:multidrug efflux pump subunit AcrA (membrane-fusion protein)